MVIKTQIIEKEFKSGIIKFCKIPTLRVKYIAISKGECCYVKNNFFGPRFCLSILIFRQIITGRAEHVHFKLMTSVPEIRYPVHYPAKCLITTILKSVYDFEGC